MREPLRGRCPANAAGAGRWSPAWWAPRSALSSSPGRAFYPAEAYHQDFLVRNPTHRYVVVHDLPKIEDLKRLHPDVYRAEPVLVAKPRP